MKKALAMLLTLAMLFSCLVVGVAEDAAYCPPQKLEDCEESWIQGEWVDEWDGATYTDTWHDGVYAMYRDGKLDHYGYSVEVEGGSVGANFDADHRQVGLNYHDWESGESYYSYNGGKTWTQWDDETMQDVKVELPAGVKVENLPALGEYVYTVTQPADNKADVDLENGVLREEEWGIYYEGKNMTAWYDDEGRLESYSYWNEDHTIQVHCDYKHKVNSYEYYDGVTYYTSEDGETWGYWDWNEETGIYTWVDAELPEVADFEKLPGLGEYVYFVSAPADKLDVESVTEGRLTSWTDEEGNIGGYSYELGELWANYDADGRLQSYYYDSEDGNLTYNYSWNHELIQIGIRTEEGWLYSEDGENWYQWVWDEEAGESNKVDAELPEGTEVETLPALGEPAEFDRLPVQDIADLETRLGWTWEEEDEEGNVTTEFYSDELAMHMTFDAEGKLVSYSHWTENWEQYATYSPDNKLLYAEFWTEEGKLLSYNAGEDAWYERIFDENGDYVEDVKLEEVPENTDILPPLTGKPDAVWYPDNTMGVVGLSLRDTFPGLTKKWYNVVPVDLTREGTTVIPMVASNLFFISNAYVTVDGDNVTVTYDDLPKFGNGWIIDECVAWFTSVDQITTEWLDAPASDLAFGQTISRANDLGDAEIALLFICNHVTYRQPYFDNGAELPRYWPNLTEWKAYRANLSAMLDQMSIVASPDAEMVASPAADDVAE